LPSRLVENCEVWRQPCRRRVCSQQIEAKGVEGPHRNAIGVCAQELRESLTQLGRCLARESDGRDLIRRGGAAVYQARNSFHQGARFASARARHNEQRPLAMGDGCFLFEIGTGDRVRRAFFTCRTHRGLGLGLLALGVLLLQPGLLDHGCQAEQDVYLAASPSDLGYFGGDPQRVTIAGESADSISVSAQMASPLSKSLIAGAIGESGSIIGALSAQPLAEAEQIGVKFAAGLRPGEAPSLAALRSMSAEQLLEATAKPGVPWFRPTVDGYFFPTDPPRVFAAGEQAHVPLLAGSNSEEMTSAAVLGSDKPTVESYRKALQRLYPGKADEVFKLYPAANEQEVLDAAQDLAGDRFIAYSTWKWIDLATYYKQVNTMFNGIFLFMGIIVFFMVLMSSVNTLLMSMFERTREIGTMLAMGTPGIWIVALFMLEATLLGLMGAIAGVVGGNLIGVLINASGLHMPPPPGYTASISFRVLHVPAQMIGSSLLVIVSLALASIVPAIRASRLKITEALSHV